MDKRFPNYLQEFLTGSEVIASAGLAAGIGGIALTASGGEFGWFLIPIILWGCGLGISAMIVPGMPTWRHKANIQIRTRSVNRMISTLWETVQGNRQNHDEEERQMLARYSSLRRETDRVRTLVESSGSRITEVNFLEIREALVSWLRIFNAWVLIRGRIHTDDSKTVARDARRIAEALGAEGLSTRQRADLERSLELLTASLENRKDLPRRQESLRAQLVALETTILDLCHEATTAVSSDSFTSALSERIERLKIEDELHTDPDARVEAWRKANSKGAHALRERALALAAEAEGKLFDEETRRKAQQKSEMRARRSQSLERE